MQTETDKDADRDRQTNNKTSNTQALSQKFGPQAINQLCKN